MMISKWRVASRSNSNQIWAIKELLKSNQISPEVARRRTEFWCGKPPKESKENIDYSEAEKEKLVLPRRELPGETRSAKRDIAIDYDIPMWYD